MRKELSVRSFLPDREVQVCLRLREIRLERKWSQPDFAKSIGISRERLANYEYAKAPVRYALGSRVCEEFDINQRWFATGRFPMNIYWPIAPGLVRDFNENALFSRVYDECLAECFDWQWGASAELAGHAFTDRRVADQDAAFVDWPAVGAPLLPSVEGRVLSYVRQVFRQVPLELGEEFLDTLIAAVDRFKMRRRRELEDYSKAAQFGEAQGEGHANSCKVTLDKSGPVGDDARDIWTMKEVENLISQVQRLTAARGAKAALARDLGVSRQAVDQWLSRKTAPATPIALRLVKWIVQSERRAKS